MIKQTWANLSPGKKKWTVIGVAFGGVLLFVWGLSSLGGEGPRKTNGKPTITNVLTDADPRGVGLDSLNAEQRAQSKELNDLKLTLKNLMNGTQAQQATAAGLKEIQGQIGDLTAKLEATQAAQQKAEQDNRDLSKQLQEAQSKAPTPDKAAELERKAAQQQTQAQERQRYDRTLMDPKRNQGNFFANAPAPEKEPEKPGAAPKKEEPPKIMSYGDEAPAEDPDADAKEEDVYLPAGAILSGAIITGIDAPTGNGARKDPFPVLLRVKKEAVLPNRFRADVRECFLIASAFGDLSSERAYMRAETISCVRDDGGIIESGMDAYASGEDGKAGVRGRLVSKQGAILARSLMAGFMQGVSDAFSVRQVPSISIASSGSGTNGRTVSPVYEQAFNSQAMQGAMIGGTGKALERIADFYLEMAENLYPVIEVDAAREIDFVVKKGVQLKLKTLSKNKT